MPAEGGLLRSGFPKKCTRLRALEVIRLHTTPDRGGLMTVCFQGAVILPGAVLPEAYVLCEKGG